MSVFIYIVLALALGTTTFVVMRSCAEQTPISLVRGMAVAALLGFSHCLLMAVGFLIGNLIMFEIPDVDNLVFLGLVIFVALRLILSTSKKNRAIPAFDISRWGTVVGLSAVTGINVFIIGLALGFRVFIENDILKVLIPLFLSVFLGSYVAIMFGRQHVHLRERRWTLLAVLFLLGFALKGIL